jgi:hypothetical protein
MLQIDVVNPDPPVTHDHLARRSHRIRALDQHELVGAAMTRDLDGEHPSPLHPERQHAGTAGNA